MEAFQVIGVDGTTFAVMVTEPPVWQINKLFGSFVYSGLVVITIGCRVLEQPVTALNSST